MQHHGVKQLKHGGVWGVGFGSGSNGPKQGVVGWRPLGRVLEGPKPLSSYSLPASSNL